ncbi:unnamed protein product, partial [Mesorhabditis belari]|uniref:Replication termination factor 2 n=1 Tax=Mesorhabditis belari TaxID=2138241 RepID=A0A915H6L3_9BILA
MGADGGTIPKRCELVRKSKKVEKIERAVKNATKWRTCQLSQQPLKKPIIACRLGRLYNKEAIIEAILNKTIGKIDITAHIKGVKDFKELRLTVNKDYTDDGAKGDSYLDVNQTPYICPVTSFPMNGNQSFVFNWKCGCVFSEKALNEIKSESCHGCSQPMSPEDIIVLNPSEELLAEYKERLATEKKVKKEKKVAEKEANGTNQVVNEPVAGPSNGAPTRKHSANEDQLPPKAQPVGEAAVAVNQVKKAEKRKAEAMGILKGKVSIQEDPTKSDVYKKLFTTCEEAKNKPEQHWVTHNPLFY